MPRNELSLITLPAEVCSVPTNIALPFGWDVSQSEDCRHRTNRLACGAINTGGWIDVHLILFGTALNAVDGTNVNAGKFLGANARFSDHERQNRNSSIGSFEVVGIHCCEVLPLFRQVVFGEDGLNRTRGLTSAAVDTFIGMNVEHLRCLEVSFVFSGMNAINGADVHTCGVLGTNTGFCDHVGHLKPVPPFRVSACEVLSR